MLKKISKESRKQIRAEIEKKILNPLYKDTLSFFDSLSDEECFSFLIRAGIIDESGLILKLPKRERGT